MLRFKDRAAIVTGAGAGIGRAAAQRLAAEGAAVLVTDRDLGAADEVCREIRGAGGTAESMGVDVASVQNLEDMAGACVEAFGSLDVLVNNAGVAIPGSVTSASVDEWQSLMDINLRSMWLAMKFAIPLMPERGGAIVNMSSCQALLGFPGWAGYAATKGAILALTQQSAVEYARQGIRINAVAPGTIMTPMNEKIFAEAPDAEALAKSWGDQHALGRFGEAHEVAAAIAFLASDDASFITGTCLPVDGGMRILGPSGQAV